MLPLPIRRRQHPIGASEQHLLASALRGTGDGDLAADVLTEVLDCDPDGAPQWFLRAVEAGDPSAMCQIGALREQRGDTNDDDLMGWLAGGREQQKLATATRWRNLASYAAIKAGHPIVIPRRTRIVAASGGGRTR